VFDRQFLNELAKQAPEILEDLIVEPRIVSLKGIGSKEAIVLPSDSQLA
jgi:hypothetical protein